MLIMMQDPSVSNAMVSFLQPLVQSVLPNATATAVVLNNFTVCLKAKALTTHNPACFLHPLAVVYLLNPLTVPASCACITAIAYKGS